MDNQAIFKKREILNGRSCPMWELMYFRFKDTEIDFTGIRFKMREVITQHVRETIEFRTTLKGDDLPDEIYCDGCTGFDGAGKVF